MAKPSYEMLLTALNTAVVLMELQIKHPELTISKVTLKNLNEIIKDAKRKDLNEAVEGYKK
jgi:hypothetical protein